MTRKIDLFIKDILDEMTNAENFLSDLGFDEFLKDTKTSYAVVRCIEIIGEATKNIPTNLKQKHKEIPWKKMAGMRDKIIHFYFGVKYQVVWSTIKEEIPQLKPLIEKLYLDLTLGK